MAQQQVNSQGNGLAGINDKYRGFIDNRWNSDWRGNGLSLNQQQAVQNYDAFNNYWSTADLKNPAVAADYGKALDALNNSTAAADMGKGLEGLDSLKDIGNTLGQGFGLANSAMSIYNAFNAGKAQKLGIKGAKESMARDREMHQWLTQDRNELRQQRSDITNSYNRQG